MKKMKDVWDENIFKSLYMVACLEKNIFCIKIFKRKYIIFTSHINVNKIINILIPKIKKYRFNQ